MRTRTADEAAGRWPGILQALGVQPKHLVNRHGPCPICGGKDRFRFDDKDGRGTWYCSHCGSGDGFTLLAKLHGWDFRGAAKEVDAILGTIAPGPIKAERTEESKLQALRQVWGESRAVMQGDPVWRYLHNRIGMTAIPADLRFHPALTYWGEDGCHQGTYPAMLALLRDPGSEIVSVHRTYLTDAGSKAPVGHPKKIMPGRSLNRAAVRLSEVVEDLGISEGIETALAASIEFGMPVWAATSAQLLEAWEPPPGVRRILIAGDNDASFTGQAAAFALARRLAGKGYEVEVRIPEIPGIDWAD